MKTLLQALVLAAALSFGLAAGVAHGAPPAGTVIGNQATATYNDSTGTARIATSNLVQTTVTQVKSFTLAFDGFRTAAPGQTVYYPHTLTNTGNGTDTYTLNAPTTGGAFTHTGLVYYVDADGNGVPDNFTPIASSGAIAMGGTLRFVVAGTVPGGATNGQQGTITVSVTDTNAPPSTLTNLDTTTVALSAVQATKALSQVSGPSPNAGPITVTLSYNNTGSAAATNLELRDVIPAGMTYIAGSGRWSVSGATALTDSNAADPAGIAYDFNVSAANRVSAVIASVAAGATGNLRFDVSVDAGRPPGNIDNQAQYLTTTQLGVNTNVASYNVLRAANVVANGSATSSVNGTAEPVVVASAAPGATVDFQNFIWNTGNGADTFVIALSGTAAWPAGTTFTLLQTDGATSLVANTTPSIPAWGPGCPAPFVADAATQRCGYRVYLRVQLPANAASAGALTVTKTATSTYDSARSDPVIDQLSAIAVNAIDLTNNTARADSTPAGTANAGNAATTGFGSTAATVIATNTVTPASAATTVTRFRLYVNNTEAISDSFNLTVAGTPAGWAIAFRADGGAGNCTTVGAVFANTGAIAAGANRQVCAEVTVPAATTGQAAPGTYNLDFRAESALNATVFDVKRDAVTVNALRAMTLTPNGAQVTFPGGSVLYTHTLANLGNVNEPVTFVAGFLTDSRAPQGWTSVAYRDNGNGTFDPGVDDVPANQVTVATAFTVNVGANQVFFVRVTSPGTALPADPANITTLTATYNAGASTASATDSTTVNTGLVLLKEQVAVSCAAPGPHAGYSAAAIPPGPATVPGSCIAYRITATNGSGVALAGVTVNDNIPANTRQRNSCGAPAAAPAGPVVSSPGDGNAGTVSAAIGALAPAQVSVLSFCVRIQ